MAMIRCRECGKEISSTATQCPNCGAATIQGRFRGEYKGLAINWVFIAVFILTGLILIFKNFEFFADYLKTDYKEAYMKYYEEGRKGFWKFILGLGLFVGGAIDLLVLRRRLAQIERRERAYQRQADQQNQREMRGTFAFLPNGGWRCVCGRTNFGYTSTCACGKNKEELAKNQGKAESERWLCRKCGASSPSVVTRCIRCGSPKEEMQPTKPAEPAPGNVDKVFCIACGARLTDGASFCAKCGKKQ